MSANANDSDKELANKLSQLNLTERLRPARLSRLEDCLPGVKSREAQIGLADVSAFLALPTEETLSALTQNLYQGKLEVS